MGAIREFMQTHYRHFNARETVAAAQAWEAHLEAGGKMMVTLAGAMSTGELGIILARMIREGKVHAISCTGANLEEDVFNLLAHDEYEIIADWRAPASFRAGREAICGCRRQPCDPFKRQNCAPCRRRRRRGHRRHRRRTAGPRPHCLRSGYPPRRR